MEPRETTPSGVLYNLISLYRIVRRRLFVFLAVLVAVFGLVLLLTLYAVPRYRATATILIAKDSAKVDFENVFTIDPSEGPSFRTRIQLIKSRRLASEVCRSLRERGKLSPDLATPDDLLDAVEVQPRPRSRIVELSVYSTDPEAAAEYANTIARTFIEFYSRENRESLSFYTTQLKALEAQIADCNERINDFIRKNGLITPEMWKAFREELTRLRSEVAQQRNDLRIRTRRCKEIEKVRSEGGDLSNLLFLQEDPLLAEMRKEILSLEKELSIARLSYGPKHSKILSLEASLAKQKQILNDTAEQLADSYISETEDRKVLLDEMEQELRDSEARAQRMLTLLQSYTKLERDLKSSQSLYDIVLQKMKESDLTAQGGVKPIEVIDKAVVPNRPYYPKVKLNLAAGLLLGLVLAVLASLLMEYFDDSIRSSDEALDCLREVTGDQACILGYVQRLPGRSEDPRENDRICERMPRSVFAEVYRNLRTSLIFSFKEEGPKSILVTSPGSLEGKTTIVSNLGIAFAQNGQKTVIIDGDLRKPRLHRTFEADNSVGLSTVLAGKASLDEAIRPTSVPMLDIIPSGFVPPLPSELLSGEALPRMLAELKNRYDWIIIDAPPGIVTDPVILSAHVDGTVLVVRNNSTSRKFLRHFVTLLRQGDSRITGLVVNDVNVTEGYYERYYRKGYYFAGDESGEGVRGIPGKELVRS